MNKKHKDLEVRYSEVNKKWELVQWRCYGDKPDTCFVVAFFDQTDEGCDVKFIGSRPFNYYDPKTLWKMLKYGHSIVEAEFMFNEEIY